MNLKPIIAAAFLCGGAVMTGGCMHTGHERTGGDVMSDTSITTKVKSALLAEKDVNSFDISVTTFEGTVQLSGFVDSQWQIDKAVQVTTAVSGVRKVKNNLVHKPS